MATRKVRRTVNDFARRSMTYLTNRTIVSEAEKPRDAAKRWLKPYILENGQKDEKGNFNTYFEGDAILGFYGMQQRRVPGAEYFDENEVTTFLVKKDVALNRGPKHPKALTSRVVKMVPFVDQDELYTLQAEGKITEQELRKLIHKRDDTYQLWPITEPPLDYEDDE